MNNESLLSNNVTIDVLQRLLYSESKPSCIEPIDIAIAAYLTLRRCEDHEILDSQATLGARLGVDRQTVRKSLARLKKYGWITASGRGNGRTNGLSIRIESFPAAQPIRDKITPQAGQLAGLYMVALQKLPKERKKFGKNWLKRQVPSAQVILTLCDGNLDLARRIIGRALVSPKFKQRSAISLYHIRCVWKQLRKELDAQDAHQVTQELSKKGEQK